MKIYELLSLHRELLSLMAKNGLKINDFKYVELFKEYDTMTRGGEKATYAVAMLAERYGICERKVYYVIKCFRRDCNIHAVV